MNSRCLTLLTFGVFVVVTSSAQTSSQQSTAEVNRNETSGYIPQFTSKNKLGNSSIFQAGMDVGVNTTNPQATMDVESADIFGVLGNTSSRGLYATGVYGRTATPAAMAWLATLQQPVVPTTEYLDRVPAQTPLEYRAPQPPPTEEWAYMARPLQAVAMPWSVKPTATKASVFSEIDQTQRHRNLAAVACAG